VHHSPFNIINNDFASSKFYKQMHAHLRHCCVTLLRKKLHVYDHIIAFLFSAICVRKIREQIFSASEFPISFEIKQ